MKAKTTNLHNRRSSDKPALSNTKLDNTLYIVLIIWTLIWLAVVLSLGWAFI